MDLLCLTRYDRAGASSRYRTYQYLPHLRDAGFNVEEAPLLGHGYVDNLYRGSRQSAIRLLRSALERAWKLRRARKYDIVWIEKELFPWVPDVFEQLLRRFGARMVIDYDDAIFHRYDQHRSALVRRVLGRKIDRVMAAATLVIAGNAYLAERARAAGAAAVEILPTVIDLERYPVHRQRSSGPLTIGWIGSPSTQRYLLEISGALAAFCAESHARVVAIGPRPDFSVPGVPLEVVPWSEDGEVRAIQQFDIGLMPLPDSPFERGKCGFKLVQYMGCGLPVIASPVGVNREIVKEGATGFLAATEEQWLAALRGLGASEELRRRMGLAGRTEVEGRFSLKVVAPRLVDLLMAVARPRAQRAASAPSQA